MANRWFSHPAQVGVQGVPHKLSRMDLDFTARRARALARLCAYTLLVIFLISLVVALLPLPLGDPQRALGLVTEVMERSTVPLVAVLFLYFGLADDAFPGIWECRFALAVRPLLRLAALLYLLSAIAVFSAAQRLEVVGTRNLTTQLQTSLSSLGQLRDQVERAPNADVLRRLVSQQPGLIQAMGERGGALGGQASFAQQRAVAADLLERAEANLRSQGLQRRADASGNLSRQTLRLSLTALAYAIFYLLAALIWPRSVAATLEKVLDARRRDSEDDAHLTEPAA